MKKMNYGSYGCEISVKEDFMFSVPGSYGYERDVVAYAVERFFSKNEKMRKEFTQESWKIRLAKGKRNKQHEFSYTIPANLMELPGNWIKVSGKVESAGVIVKKVEVIETV